MIPTSLNDNIIFQAGEFSKEFSKELSRTFREEGLDVTPEQFAILAVLWFKEGITQKELADQIGRDKTTVSRVIDSMIRRDLINRIESENDKRARQIFLTEKGKALQSKLVELSGNRYISCLRDIPESSIKIALFVLARMRQNLK